LCVVLSCGVCVVLWCVVCVVLCVLCVVKNSGQKSPLTENSCL
jgi:hypothetical protein